MRAGLLVLLCLVVSACAPDESTNQCMRRELFKECMQLLPAGPVATHYNDWAEVVDQCEQRAYYESIQLVTNIPQECI